MSIEAIITTEIAFFEDFIALATNPKADYFDGMKPAFRTPEVIFHAGTAIGG